MQWVRFWWNICRIGTEKACAEVRSQITCKVSRCQLFFGSFGQFETLLEFAHKYGAKWMSSVWIDTDTANVLPQMLASQDTL